MCVLAGLHQCPQLICTSHTSLSRHIPDITLYFSVLCACSFACVYTARSAIVTGVMVTSVMVTVAMLTIVLVTGVMVTDLYTSERNVLFWGVNYYSRHNSLYP